MVQAPRLLAMIIAFSFFYWVQEKVFVADGSLRMSTNEMGMDGTTASAPLAHDRIVPTIADATIMQVPQGKSSMPKTEPELRAHRGSHRNGGIIVFIHMPKSGGDSIWKSVKAYPWLTYYRKKLKIIEEAVADPALSIGQNKILWAELHTGMPSIIELQDRLRSWRDKAAENGIPFFVFSMVREPIPFAVSFYEWRCIFFPGGKNMCGKWNDETEESLRATARTDPQTSFFVNEFHTHMKQWDAPSHKDLEGTWDALLSNVEWVGRTEEYSDTTHVVEEVLVRKNLEWLHTHKFPAKLHAHNLTDFTKSFIQERSGLDQELYDRVQATYRLEELWEN